MRMGSLSVMEETHGQVERRDVLGERSDRDAMHAGLGDRAHRLQRDAAGRLEFRAVPGHAYGFPHPGEVEVVEEDLLRAGVERLAKLLEGFHFDLQHRAFGSAVARVAYRVGDAA